MDELWEIADSLHIQSLNLKASLKIFILKVRILRYEINAVGKYRQSERTSRLLHNNKLLKETVATESVNSYKCYNMKAE